MSCALLENTFLCLCVTENDGLIRNVPAKATPAHLPLTLFVIANAFFFFLISTERITHTIHSHTLHSTHTRPLHRQIVLHHPGLPIGQRSLCSFVSLSFASFFSPFFHLSSSLTRSFPFFFLSFSSFVSTFALSSLFSFSQHSHILSRTPFVYPPTPVHRKEKTLLPNLSTLCNSTTALPFLPHTSTPSPSPLNPPTLVSRPTHQEAYHGHYRVRTVLYD